jgi:hypothetical protein
MCGQSALPFAEKKYVRVCAKYDFPPQTEPRQEKQSEKAGKTQFTAQKSNYMPPPFTSATQTLDFLSRICYNRHIPIRRKL